MRLSEDVLPVVIVVALSPRHEVSPAQALRRTRLSQEEIPQRAFETHFSAVPSYLVGTWEELLTHHEALCDPVRARVFTSRSKKLLVVEGRMRMPVQADPGSAAGDGGPALTVLAEDLEILFNEAAKQALEDSGLASDFDIMWVNRTIAVGADDVTDTWMFNPGRVDVHIDGAEDLSVWLSWGNNLIRGPGLENLPEDHLVSGLVIAQFIWMDLESSASGLASVVRRLQEPTLKRSELEDIEKDVVALSLATIGHTTNLEHLHQWSQGLWGCVAADVLRLWGVDKLTAGLDRRFDEVSRIIGWRRNVVDSRLKAQVESFAFILATLSIVDLLMTVYQFARSGEVLPESLGTWSGSLFHLFAAVPSDVWLTGAIAVVAVILLMYTRSAGKDT